MSLAINARKVSHVLLADGWHAVKIGTFSLDAYEYLDGDDTDDKSFILHGGGQSGICATGFEFYTDDGTYIAGPLTSIIAVRELVA